MLLAGEPVEVPAWAHLSGLDVEDTFSLTTPLGELRALSKDRARVSRPQSAPRLELRTTFPLTVEIPYDLTRGPYPEVLLAAREFQRRIDHVRLAVLLALDRPEPIGLHVAAREISDPLSLASLSWPWFVPPFTVPLEDGDQHRIGVWAERIAAHHDPSIELATRRALAAATVGRESEDRLIDAVIALENLVGVGAGQRPAAAFRNGVAALLSDDDIERDRYRDRAEVIYKARSDIVHGRHEHPIQELETLRVEALQMLLQGLRRLCAELPHLIADRRRGRTLTAP